MTDGPGFTQDDVFALGDVVATAFLAGLIPGTMRFSRAILGAGYRRTAEPVPDFDPVINIPDRTHYFEVGASEYHDGMVGWGCSCASRADRSFGELGGAFADAVAHVPAGENWRAQGVEGE